MSRIRADKFVNNAANGAPELTYGAEIPVGVGLTGAGGINITGIATAASFSGNLTGNISGTTGTFSGDVDIADKIIHTGDTNTAIRFPAADTFSVETSGSEAIRVDSSQRLLLGTSTSPTAGNGQYSNLVIQGYPSTPQGAGHISLQRGQAAFGANNQIGLINFGDNTGASYAGIECYADADSGANDFPGRLVFSTTPDGAASPTEKLRILSGGGITFNGDTATANALDDYEEGTWTPTLTDGYTRTYSSQNGVYIKVGRLVYLRCQLQGSTRSGSAASYAYITLPFPASGMSAVIQPSALCHVSSITHTDIISGAPQWDATTEFRIYETIANGGQSYLAPSGIAAAFQIGWTFTYMTS